jgi:hypothetical protein
MDHARVIVERLSDEVSFDDCVGIEGAMRTSGTSSGHARPMLVPIIPNENRTRYAKSATTLKSSTNGHRFDDFLGPETGCLTTSFLQFAPNLHSQPAGSHDSLMACNPE